MHEVPILAHIELCPACKYNLDMTCLHIQVVATYIPHLLNLREGMYSAHLIHEVANLWIQQ
jgi:hypothetical protein